MIVDEYYDENSAKRFCTITFVRECQANDNLNKFETETKSQGIDQRYTVITDSLILIIID
jgi:hypothetical protein